MATANGIKERLANIDKLEKDGKVSPETASALKQQAQDMLGEISGKVPDLPSEEAISKIKEMERRPFLGLAGVNTREELEKRATEETAPRFAPAGSPKATSDRPGSDPERRADREQAILASILSKARYSDVLAKPGPGMIKPTDMTRMFGINIPGQAGTMSMGIPRDDLTDEEMQFLMDRNARLAGGT